MHMAIRDSISRRKWVKGLLAAALGVAVVGPAWMTSAVRAADAKASDWPQWRGPKQDGKSAETGLLKTWPKEGPPLAYKATGLGAGYSSVSVVGDKVLTMGDKDGNANVMALALADGKILWTTAIGKPGGGGGYPGPRCTPSIDGDKLYAIGQDGDVVCLNVADGKEVWHKNMKKDFKGEMMSGWGYSESPMVDGANLIITPGGKDGTLAALNKATGEIVWRSKDFTDKAAYTGVIAVEMAGQRQYIQLTAENVAGIDAATGKLLWKAARPGQTAVIPTPIYSDGIVYVTSGYGVGCSAFKVQNTGGVYTVDKLYANKVMVNHHGGVILHEGNLYGFSDGKGWTCQDLKGGEVVWKQKEDAPGKGAITYADGHFILRDEGGKGTIALIEATNKGYTEQGRFDQPERTKQNSWPHPVVAGGGKLFIRDQDNLFVYDLKAK
jgi:outer membrane protein assembly factor BamB